MSRRELATWTVDVDGVTAPLTVLEVDVELDERNTIYCRATVKLAPVSGTVLGQLSPIPSGKRMTLIHTRTTEGGASQSRPFYLWLHTYRREALGGVELEAASDDAIPEIRAELVTPYRDYRSLSMVGDAPNSSVRNVVELVLRRALKDGTIALMSEAPNPTPDTSLNYTSTITNLLINPVFQTNTTGWAGVRASLSRVASGSSTFDLRATITDASANPQIASAHDIDIDRKTTYTAYAHNVYNEGAAATTFQLAVEELDAAGNNVTTRYGPVTTIPAGQSRNLPLTFTSNRGRTERARVVLIRGAADRVVGRRWSVSFMSFFEGTVDSIDLERPVIWHGSSSSPGVYAFSWSGAAHASTSTRTRIDDRAQDLLLHRTGTTYREFLDPIVDVVGARLWCNELREWRLSALDGYSTGNTITLGPQVFLAGTDSISVTEMIDGIPTTATGLVVVWKWTDAMTGQPREYIERTGNDNGRVARVEVDRPYAGPGGASKILGRLSGRHRIIQPETLVDLFASPGDALTLTYLNTQFTGRASRVMFRYSESEDTMRITPRDLAVVP